MSNIGFAAVSTVSSPPTDAPNTHYVGNRAPLKPSPFIKLPVGQVKAHGWLLKQLELQSEGFHGHLGELSDFLRKEDNAWLTPSGAGKNGWEEVPYWLKGYGDCAYLLGNEAQIKEARIWIEGAIKNQREDGFFGPRPGVKATVDSTQGKYDLWPNMVMLNCLQSYYEFTGDTRVTNLMTRYFRWELGVPDADFLPPYWQKIRAGDNLHSVYWLYNRTGEPWLLELATKIYRNTANWTDGLPDWHNVNISQAFGGPGFYWMQSKEQKHLDAPERNWQTIRKMYGQVPGGMFGGDENCRPGYSDPRQAVETCGMVEMMFSHERLLAATGNPIWADRCEDVAFNSLPAALLADFKGLRYLTAPNMILSDRLNKAPGIQNGGPMFHYNPYDHRCCQHNFGHGWPYFTEHLWMATPGNGLAAVMYSPNEVKAKVGNGVEVTLIENTRYPFDELVELTLKTPSKVAFPLYLRVPEWCEQPVLLINGSKQKLASRRLSYISIQRTWSNGDKVSLTLPMKVALRTWTLNHNSVSVDRGPLTYSLNFGEKLVQKGGTKDWPAWEIYPTEPWNYGLVLNAKTPAESFKVEKRAWPASDMPFTKETAPIQLVAQARAIPQWQADHLGLVGLLQASPVKSDQPEKTVTMVPMGAARIRIASFPVIGTGAVANIWAAPPQPLACKASASYCNPSDDVNAMRDQVEPKNSNDHGLGRFTWYDHKGSAEWVQYDFDAPRKFSKVNVYWFDDTPGGQCGLPQSWKVLYRSGDQWKEVANAKIDPVAKDKYNQATFDTVETTGLRIEVQLKPELSGGILEWKVD